VIVRQALQPLGYQVQVADDASAAIMQAARSAPDLVIVDLGHHDPDRIEVIRRRQGWTEAPIIRAGCSPSRA
jgi:DNA-binding response OmpR family regulator